ncbi:MAG TPA: hypothetical protein VG962_11830 [Steroidobacteraceae bacterium]|nr:hypothetical protein [Steroidobacteraceae bacterium]
MNEPSNEDKSYWVAGARTRRHRYFYPRNNMPGILLFGVIAVLGCLTLVVAMRHYMVARSLTNPDFVLGVIGLFAVLLSIYQSWKLWRMDQQ